MRKSLSPPPGRRPGKQIYRLRASEHGRTVTAPDGEVSITNSDGPIRVTGVFKEPFASLFAEPFDAKRAAKALIEMDPAQRERIGKLHATLGLGDSEPVPPSRRRKRR